MMCPSAIALSVSRRAVDHDPVRSRRRRGGENLRQRLARSGRPSHPDFPCCMDSSTRGGTLRLLGGIALCTGRSASLARGCPNKD
eukprot:5575016-Prymnesium_polylepis.2